MFFCDESGRTGANFFDPNQPVYVLAGYLLGEHQRGLLCSLVDRLRHEGAPGPEIKSKKLLKTSRWAKVAAEFIANANKHFTPITVVFEKRYYCGMRLSEALFPPELPAAEPDFARTPEAARQHAEVFGALPHELLCTLLPVLETPSKSSFTECINAVASGLRMSGQMRLADAVELRRSESQRLAELLAEELSVWNVAHPSIPSRSVNAGIAPELDAFIWSLRLINNIMVRHDLPPCEMVHDEATESLAFQRAFYAVKLNGDIDRIHSVTSGDSKAFAELQAADLLAGCTRAVIEGKWEKELSPAADAIFSNFFNSGFLAEVMGTKAFVDRLKIASIQPNLKRQRGNLG